jgi:nucleoside-diphosphate-sugar epimerase
MVYGPGDPQHRFFDPAKRMSDLREYMLLEERWSGWCCSWGYVENVAEAIAIAATNPRAAGGIYNVCEATSLSWAGLVEAIAEAVGWSGRIVIVPTGKAPEQLKLMSKVLDLEQDLLLDSTRIRSERGYAERVGFPETLRRTVEWEAANPPDPVNAAAFDYAREDAIVEELVSERIVGSGR